MIDPRVRQLHISKYGETEDVLDYVRVLEDITPVPDDKPGENHHMCAKSAFPEFADLKAHPWNRLRVSRGIHIGLTKIQSWFDGRLRVAVLLMKGMTAEAYQEHQRVAGRLGGKRTRELYPDLAKRRGRTSGRKAVESGQLAGIRGMGGKKLYELGQGLFGMTPEQRQAASKLGGEICGKKNAENGHMEKICTAEVRSKGGKTQGRKNVESGHWARLCSSGIGGKVGGARTQELHPELYREIGRRTAEKPGHMARIGKAGSHILWHVNRNIVNPACSLCQAPAALELAVATVLEVKGITNARCNSHSPRRQPNQHPRRWTEH